MGYLNQPEKTAEAIDAEGWLHTGDVGSDRRARASCSITDRMKDIIITAGGKNITPTEFENELKFSPYVTDAVVIGDRRLLLTCLVMIDQENVKVRAGPRPSRSPTSRACAAHRGGAGVDPGRDRTGERASSRASSRSRSSASSSTSSRPRTRSSPRR
jgi:long-subunit acyl-CoA synthetase (AMP-forming)